MRFTFLRSTLLGLAVGVLATPIARADGTRAEAGATDVRAGSGAERMGGQPMTGPPHAPTVVGQSPLPLVSGDPRDEEKKKPQRREPNQPASDLKPEGQPSK
jgi:hypothetical protein